MTLSRLERKEDMRSRGLASPALAMLWQLTSRCRSSRSRHSLTYGSGNFKLEVEVRSARVCRQNASRSNQHYLGVLENEQRRQGMAATRFKKGQSANPGGAVRKDTATCVLFFAREYTEEAIEALVEVDARRHEQDGLCQGGE